MNSQESTGLPKLWLAMPYGGRNAGVWWSMCHAGCTSTSWRTNFPRVNWWAFYRPDAYISLESALAEWGISTQSPSALTCVTTGFPREFRRPSVQIVYRHIAKKLHWGFETKRTRHGSYRIAEPEKALLDWIYLQRHEGLPVAFDELSLNVIDKKKLRQYALKYPNSVQQTLQEAWV